MIEAMAPPMASATGGLFGGGGFNPFVVDTSPLQAFLQGLAQQVDELRADNQTLRVELTDLKAASRLDALEMGLQQLAENVSRPGTAGYDVFNSQYLDAQPGADADSVVGSATEADGVERVSGLPHIPALRLGGGSLSLNPTTTAHPAPTAGGNNAAAIAVAATSRAAASSRFAAGGGGAGTGMGWGGGSGLHSGQAMLPAAGDPSWILAEFNTMKDRICQMERKAEALWHKQESDEQLRAAVERLKVDVDSQRAASQEVQAAAHSAQDGTERLERTCATNGEVMKELQDKLQTLEAHHTKMTEERKEVAVKYESSTNQIWDQIRHVESSLNHRLGLAETAQAGTMQELDEAKEATNEVLARVDETKRHLSALESKLESFNSAVAAAIAPLHNSLERQADRLDELQTSKQDESSAVKQENVNQAMSQAVAHADGRVNNLLRTIAGVEQKMEVLHETKPDKSEVVLAVDLKTILTGHAAELDTHLDALKADVMAVLQLKADRDELAALDTRLGGRVASLEGAILKGLKAISDKVSAALAEKLDLLRFNEFKIQVRAILADVEDRLRDWSPLAMGFKASMDPNGQTGATTCLMCDSRVRSTKELKSMGFANGDKVFSPERLPVTDAMLPNICTKGSASTGAYQNAKLARNKADAQAALHRPTNTIMEGLPGSPVAMPNSPGQSQTPHTAHSGALAALDAAALTAWETPRSLQLAKTKVKVDVETISGQISAGKIPQMRNPGRGGASSPISFTKVKPLPALDLTVGEHLTLTTEEITS